MVKKAENPQPQPADPENDRKKRLRFLALSSKLLRRDPASPSAPLELSRSVQKLEGRDIVKRGQRKSRYLFSFPGLLAPLSGGRIGELADLATKNPILYLEFPKGRVKLFGTHVYPKNKYLTLQLTRSTKGVTCEDCFESLIVFPEAWWIGSKEENPEEHQLEFPKDLNEDINLDYDFKGGAGATFEEASGAKKPMEEHKVPVSPDTEMEEDIDDSYPSTGIDVANVLEATPVRQSARMVGRTLSYAESSGNDSGPGDSEEEEHADVRSDDASRRSLFVETDDSSPTTSTFPALVSELVNTEKHKKQPSVKKSKEDLPNKKGTPVQCTLSNLFEKAQEKSKRIIDDSAASKASSSKHQQPDPKKKINQVHVKVSKKEDVRSGGRKSGSGTVTVRKKSQDDSDDDWTGWYY